MVRTWRFVRISSPETVMTIVTATVIRLVVSVWCTAFDCTCDKLGGCSLFRKDVGIQLRGDVLRHCIKVSRSAQVGFLF